MTGAATLDSPQARERSVRRVLASRASCCVELRFHDAIGAEHEIRSCPVSGGRYLYDSSEAWGLRAIGLCRDDLPEQMAALGTDYAERCAEEEAAVCRALRLSDILRRRDADDEGEEP